MLVVLQTAGLTHRVFARSTPEVESELYTASQLPAGTELGTASTFLEPELLLALLSLLILAAGSTLLHLWYWPSRLRNQRNALRAEWHRDLHDGVQPELDRIVSAVQTAQLLAYDPLRLRSKLQEISTSTQRAAAWISTRLWWRASSTVQCTDFVDYLRYRTAEVLRTAEIKHQFDSNIPAPQFLLQRQWCDEMVLVLSEALQNVVTHSDASEVIIRLNWNIECNNPSGVQHVDLTVVDDGRTLPEDMIFPEGNALVTIRSRVDKLGGDLAAKSTSGQGTTLTFHLPCPSRASLHPNQTHDETKTAYKACA